MLRMLTDADKQELGQHRALPCARAYHCTLYGPGATTTDGGCVPVLCPISSLASTDAIMQSMASKSRFHASHLLPVLDSCAVRRDETHVRALICSTHHHAQRHRRSCARSRCQVSELAS